MVSNLNNNVIVKKRGRKPKTPIENNINISIQETNKTNETNETNEIIKNNIDDLLKSTEFTNACENVTIDNITITDENKPATKKRGRKPKGGKIIQQPLPINNNKIDKPNIILHLKCNLKDLHNNNVISSEIQSYNFQLNNSLNYDVIMNETCQVNDKYNNIKIDDVLEYDDCDDDDRYSKDNDIRDIWKKLKSLEHNLHTNNICDKKSACFWCTYDFDNPPIYIPKHYIKDTYHVYGCFCSPECAVAHLMEENIDSSSKFERYHLLNHIYSKIFEYKKNIKPAPNPYYMLEKYYGNLSIQEYRSLLRNERLFLIVDKPLTRILPELHEDNDDFIINNKIIPSNTYQIKKRLQKKQTKINILSEKFGLTQN